MEEVKGVLNDSKNVVHPCKCISVEDKMVVYKFCKIHNLTDKDPNIVEKSSTKRYDDLGRVIRSTVVTEYKYDDFPPFPDRLDSKNASNLRLYTIIGIILG